jgi:tetratricopeptide (TPR) repeat protein
VNPAELFSSSDRLHEANHLNRLAAVHEKRQEYSEAERLYEEALAMYEEIFGIEHFTTALATRNLARVLRVQGKTAEASLLEDHASDILSRRGESSEIRKNPFGGSSGFFELMGFDSSTGGEETHQSDEPKLAEPKPNNGK